MIPLGLSLIAALGVFLTYSAAVFGRTELRPPPGWFARFRARGTEIDAWLRQAGLERVDRREFTAAVGMIFLLSTSVGYVAFGGLVPALAIGTFGASFPLTTYRHRREARRLRAQQAWPRMIEEIRVQTSSIGRSIPQALFEVGGRGPEELRPSFAAAQREWLLTTDLAKTFAVLKARLGDPTADMTCETLLIAHELGGAELDRRLEALAADRRQDVQGRKDARSRQAGARFARVFVLLVPAGMALAGSSIGSGRAAYRSSTGQVVVMIALLLVIGCWVWAGRVMRLPEPERVFRGTP